MSHDPNKVVVHHIVYDYKGGSHKQEEITTIVYYAEHHILTQLQRRGKYISKGFIQHLKYFIWKCETEGVGRDLVVDDKNLKEVGCTTESTVYDAIKEARERRGLSGHNK